MLNFPLTKFVYEAAGLRDLNVEEFFDCSGDRDSDNAIEGVAAGVVDDAAS